MNTGIIMEISNNKAFVMKDDGSFIELTAECEWQVGDTIPMRKKLNYSSVHILYKIAACFLLFVLMGYGSYSFYFNETSLISMDVNPSIELHLNAFNRVISYSAYNDDGKVITDAINIKNISYDNAIKIILASPLIKEYTDSNSYFIFAVQTKDQSRETELYESVQKTASAIIADNMKDAKVEYTVVDEALVSEAHGHGLTPGKYKILMDLKEVSPEIEITDYCHDSVNDIKSMIDECTKGHGNRSGSHHYDAEDYSSTNNSDTQVTDDINNLKESEKESSGTKRGNRHHRGN